jgi:hypothetical protein
MWNRFTTRVRRPEPNALIGARYDQRHVERCRLTDSEGTACFQWAISIIMEIASQHGKGERMAFIHEQNNYQADAQRAFDFVNKNLNPRGINIRLKKGRPAFTGGGRLGL